jgi:GT2 family glycosyltransferase
LALNWRIHTFYAPSNRETGIDVSIVLLNWNSRPLVFDAAASALAQRQVRIELIIVDNGSTDGSLTELRTRFPQARFVEIGFNSGFTGGMNAGTQAAQGEFVVWQNADLVLGSDYCARAVAIMKASPDVGAAGGLVRRLVDGKQTETFDAAGYTLRPNHRPRFLPIEIEQDVMGVSGSCPIFRRTALDAIAAPVGYVLDPWYFTYGEDIDVMLRLNLAGWRVRYVPQMTAWHVRSASTAPASRFYEKPSVTQVHHFKNRLATIIKSIPRPALLRRIPVLLATEVLLPFYLLMRRPSSLWNWAKAWRQVWGERSRLFHDRAAIRAHSSRSHVHRLSRLLALKDLRTTA